MDRFFKIEYIMKKMRWVFTYPSILKSTWNLSGDQELSDEWLNKQTQSHWNTTLIFKTEYILFACIVSSYSWIPKVT